MILVIDANILFSALIKNSLTAELLFEPTLKLYAPEFLIEEFMKNSRKLGLAGLALAGGLILTGPDKEVYAKIKQAGEILQIKVLDSIIFSKDFFYSLANWKTEKVQKVKKEDMVFIETLKPYGFPTLKEIGIKED